MAFDPVPFFVGGGAQHSAEVMRLMAFLATDGLTGIIQPTDWAVVQDSPPSGNAVIRPGQGVALSRYPNVQGQSYVARSLSDTLVPVPPTAAGAGRSDLLCVRIRDTSVSTSGDPPPASVPNGPYVDPFLISNVPNTTKSIRELPAYAGTTAITLARLDIPANTGTITQAMMKDLRSIAAKAIPTIPPPEIIIMPVPIPQPETELTLFRNMTKCNGSQLHDENTSFINWPSEAVWTNVKIPKWCTHIAYFALINPLLEDGNFYGNWRLNIGGTNTGEGELNWNKAHHDDGGGERHIGMLGGMYNVPSGQRGTTVTVRSQARSDEIDYSSTVTADSRTYVRVELEFLQAPTIT